MAGFGRFKLTDALPEQSAEIEPHEFLAEVKPALTHRHG